MVNEQNDIRLFFSEVTDGNTAGLSVYFLGIGGIGMSALARYFNSRGLMVSGYDKTETPLTSQLIAEGISVHFEDDVKLVDEKASLVVYTPAIPDSHQELNHVRNNKFNLMKRSEVLGLITGSAFNICVAGTHGKTTTSTMIAHLLRHSEFGCNAFLGGIASNYNTNFWSSEKNVCVAEADEYDRSFLKLSPDIAIITAMDPDHLDIYGTADAFKRAFLEFSNKVKSGGTLIVKHELTLNNDFKAAKLITYSLSNASANAYAKNIRIESGTYCFDVCIGDELLSDLKLNMGGLHNIENAVAAIVAVRQLGIDDELIREALVAFKGVKRRFEYILKNDDIVMIDDYAHHPQELEALIDSAKGLFPQKKCTMVFQPHLYSRTRDFAKGFSSVLKKTDKLYLLPIYPARELPIEGVSSEMIANDVLGQKATCLSKEDLMEVFRNENKPELFIMAGAGDIDALVQPIKEILISKA